MINLENRYYPSLIEIQRPLSGEWGKYIARDILSIEDGPNRGSLKVYLEGKFPNLIGSRIFDSELSKTAETEIILTPYEMREASS